MAADLDESSISAANSSTDLVSPLTEAAVDEVVVPRRPIIKLQPLTTIS